jgi:hypothetical protein
MRFSHIYTLDLCSSTVETASKIVKIAIILYIQQVSLCLPCAALSIVGKERYWCSTCSPLRFLPFVYYLISLLKWCIYNSVLQKKKKKKKALLLFSKYKYSLFPFSSFLRFFSIFLFEIIMVKLLVLLSALAVAVQAQVQSPNYQFNVTSPSPKSPYVASQMLPCIYTIAANTTADSNILTIVHTTFK